MLRKCPHVLSLKRRQLTQCGRLELYFSDKANFLIVFRDARERQTVVQKLSSKNDRRDAISRSVIGNFVTDTVSKAMDKSELQLEAMTRKWQAREISNVSDQSHTGAVLRRDLQFAYLQLLNQHANRTPNGRSHLSFFSTSVMTLCRRDAISGLPLGAVRLRVSSP